ncbi:MAG: hypothetical protein ACP6IS_05505 [Candidatus Asgardarchaeia archaeon]
MIPPYIAFPASPRLLSKNVKVPVIDEYITHYWPEQKKDVLTVKWNVESTARRLIFKIYPNERPTDLRLFFFTFSKSIIELKPLLYKLRLRGKTLFPKLSTLTSYLEKLSSFSEFMLNRYTDEKIKTIPAYKLNWLNRESDISIVNFPPQKRVDYILETVEKMTFEILSYLNSTFNGVIFIDFYITDAIVNFEKSWLKKIDDLGKKFVKQKYPFFLCYSSDATLEYLRSILDIIALTTTQAELYRDILTMCLLKKEVTFTITDFVKFKYSYYSYHEMLMALEHMFRGLQELNLLERVNEYTYRLNPDVIEVL